MRNILKISLCLFVSVLISLVFLLSACKSIVIDESYADQTVEVEKGDSFTVALESNPTTGYDWYISGEGYKGCLALAGSKYEQSKQDSKLVGSGGITSFTFMAESQGSTSIIFEYKREWEKDIEPIDTFSVNIEVR